MSSSVSPLIEDFTALLDAHALAASDFGRILRELTSTSDLTLGGEWTVRHTAVHVFGSAKHYRLLAHGNPSFIRRWEDLEVFNQTLFLAIDEEQPQQLASMVEDAEEAFRTVAARHAPDDLVPIHFGMSMTIAGLVAFQCNELLMHGWDMAAVTGQETGAGTAAAAALSQLMSAWPRYFRADLGEDVTFGLMADTVRPTVFSFAGGQVKAETAEPGATYSCSTRGSAMGHLLWLGRRLDAADAGLTVSGERPDLAQRFGFPLR